MVFKASLQNRLQNDASDCDTAKEEFTDTMLGEIRRDLDSFKEKHSELFDCFLNYLWAFFQKLEFFIICIVMDVIISFNLNYL